MLKIKEGAVWPPKPDEVEFDNSSLATLNKQSGMCSPSWARITELGGRVGTFLITNMDGEAACDIVNNLAEQLDEEQHKSFMTGVRNSINLEFQRRELTGARASLEDEQLVMAGTTGVPA